MATASGVRCPTCGGNVHPLAGNAKWGKCDRCGEKLPLAAPAHKICSVCGVDVTDAERMKDELGNYYCATCAPRVAAEAAAAAVVAPGVPATVAAAAPAEAVDADEDPDRDEVEIDYRPDAPAPAAAAAAPPPVTARVAEEASLPEAEPEPEEPEEPGSEAPAMTRGMWVALLAIVLLVAGGGGGYWFFSGRWERLNEDKLVRMKEQADAHLYARRYAEAAAGYKDLLAFIGDRNLKNAFLRDIKVDASARVVEAEKQASSPAAPTPAPGPRGTPGNTPTPRPNAAKAPPAPSSPPPPPATVGVAGWLKDESLPVSDGIVAELKASGDLATLKKAVGRVMKDVEFADASPVSAAPGGRFATILPDGSVKRHLHRKALLPGGARAVVAGPRFTFYVEDVVAEKPLREIEPPEDAGASVIDSTWVALSPSAALAASGGTSNGPRVDSAYPLYVWHVETGKLAAVLTGHEARVSNAVFVPGGRLLVSVQAAGGRKPMRIWDLEKGTHRDVPLDAESDSEQVEEDWLLATPDGTHVIYFLGRSGSARWVDLRHGAMLRAVTVGELRRIHGSSGDGRVVLGSRTAGEDQRVMELWDFVGGRKLREIPGEYVGGTVSDDGLRVVLLPAEGKTEPRVLERKVPDGPAAEIVALYRDKLKAAPAVAPGPGESKLIEAAKDGEGDRQAAARAAKIAKDSAGGEK